MKEIMSRIMSIEKGLRQDGTPYVKVHTAGANSYIYPEDSKQGYGWAAGRQSTLQCLSPGEGDLLRSLLSAPLEMLPEQLVAMGNRLRYISSESEDPIEKEAMRIEREYGRPDMSW